MRQELSSKIIPFEIVTDIGVLLCNVTMFLITFILCPFYLALAVSNVNC